VIGKNQNSFAAAIAKLLLQTGSKRGKQEKAPTAFHPWRFA
jgi:hypothetical protein